MTHRFSIERSIADRLLELRADGGAGCAKDALFQHLNILNKSRIDAEHDYLVSGIRSAVQTLDAHAAFADEVIARILKEKGRVQALAESPCVDLEGNPVGPVTVDTRTVEAA